MSEEWRCPHCNSTRAFCDGVKYWAPDPWMKEINDDDSDYFECDGTRYNSMMDI